MRDETDEDRKAPLLKASIQQRIVAAQRPLSDLTDDLYDPLCRSCPCISLFLLSRATHYFPNCFSHSTFCPPEGSADTLPHAHDIKLVKSWLLKLFVSVSWLITCRTGSSWLVSFSIYFDKDKIIVIFLSQGKDYVSWWM